jgi:transmembrane sensor
MAVALWTGIPGGRPETIATPAGKRGSFTLSDGTVVELNANTSMLVENGRGERRVHLADGEAFFVVSKDRARPFIIETPAGSVRVTGTIFDVRTASSSDLEVTVVEGSVQVSPNGTKGAPASGPVVLTAGDQLSARDGSESLTLLSAGALDDALAWRRGLIVCRGMPLPEAIARFAHYNGLKITVTPAASRQTASGIGGIFSIDDPQSFYDDLGTMDNLHVSRQPDGSVRVSGANEP